MASASSYKYAGFGVRLLAYLIDAVTIGILNFIVFFVLSSAKLEVLATAVPVLIGWSYLVYMIGSRGQTLGKMALNLKVIKLETGKNPDYVSAFIREVVGRLISGIVLALGYLWMIWDPKKQGWHDKIAGTVVVKVDK